VQVTSAQQSRCAWSPQRKSPGLILLCIANWTPLIAGQAGVVPLLPGIPGIARAVSFAALSQTIRRRFITHPCMGSF
jgi:hypothetical protein